MIDDIFQGIAGALKNAFDDIECTTFITEQGLETPCFYIHLLKATDEPYPSDIKNRVQPFDIMYFPYDENDNQTMYNVARVAIEALEIIDVGDRKLRGTNISYEIQDGVLHIFVNYNVLVRPLKPEYYMETLDTDIGLKG